jgi:hypothetical protein
MNFTVQIIFNCFEEFAEKIKYRFFFKFERVLLVPVSVVLWVITEYLFKTYLQHWIFLIIFV